jgi:hypothetical protein
MLLPFNTHIGFPNFSLVFLVNYVIPTSILYIKATVVVSVCVGSAWKILPVIAHSLWCLSVVTNRAGQGGQASRCGGLGEVPFLLKKSLGKTGGPVSNQTKIQFFLKIIFIIEHIKKTIIFKKKKINK